MIRRALLTLLVLALAGCGSIPQPFRPEAPEPLLDITPITGVYVPTVNVEQADGMDGAALADAVVQALHKEEFLAFAKPPATKTHRLDGVAVKEGKAVSITWTLVAPDGATVKTFDTVAASAREAAQSLVPRVIAALSPVPEPSSPTVAANRPRLSVKISKAPGDGVKSLTAAMRQALQRQGYLIDDATPTHQVQGAIIVSPAPGGREQVDVTWKVMDAKGGELGSIAQGNTIERGLLSGPWGSLARQVAEGGAEGVSELLPKSGAATSF